jgi:tetratricopeptide (TPR) repeat protein
MAQRDTILGELMARRVPQIVGLYVGAAWLTVEMGEWLTDQLGLPAGWLVYVFIVFAVMLPSVVLLAWNHGQPGRDRWTRGEKIGLPVNALLAAVAVSALVVLDRGTGVPETVYAGSAVVERTLIDETGEAQTFAVAREGFHKRVAVFFFPREGASAGGEERAWESYAIAWLLDVDLDRDPLLTMVTPYAGDLIDELRSAGFEQAVGEPLSLDLSLAREFEIDRLIRGRYVKSDGRYRLSAEIVDVGNGRVVAELEARGATLIAAVSELSDAVSSHLFGDLERDPSAYVHIRLEEASSASVEAIEAMIQSFNAHDLDHDSRRAIEWVRRAIELDPEFALAHARLHGLLRAQGDMAGAAKAIDRALELDYKLDSELVFGLKANRYAVLGDYDKAIRVLEMWTEIHPDSFQAQYTLATNLVTLGRIDDASTALDRARQLDPENSGLDRLRFNIEKLRGNFDEAEQRLEAYIESEPQDVPARLELGNLHLLQGEFEQARSVLEDAQMVASDPFDAELQLMLADARSGQLADVLASTAGALQRLDRPADLAQVLMMRYRALSMAGRYREVLELLDRHQDTLNEAMPPINVWTIIAQVRSEAYRALGRPEAAMAALDEAESRIGDPMARYMAINRLEVLADFPTDPAAMARQLERFRFFETNFSFSGTLAYLRYAEALVAESQGRPSDAVEKMRAGIEALQASGVALDLYALDNFDFVLGRMLVANGESAEARHLIEALLARHPAFGEARLLLARLDAADGRLPAARAEVERLMRQWADADADYGALQEAQELLASLPAD